MDNIQKGKEAEQVASIFFVRQGYQIMARNYRYKRAEIDLIIRRDDMMVFVEVKYRTTTKYGFPEEFVSDHQKEMILGAADYYLTQAEWEGHIRFDIIAVDASNRIEHFQDAFY